MKTITVTLNNQSFLDIRDKFNDCFYIIKSDAWYDNEDFAKEKITGTWEVDIEPVKDSFNKTWNEQQSLIKDEVPPAAILAYAICQHFKDTGEKAFKSIYVRTSSLDSGGFRVSVGHSAVGLSVSGYWDGGRSSVLGLASARKLNLENGSLEHVENLSLELRVQKLEAQMKGISNALESTRHKEGNNN